MGKNKLNKGTLIIEVQTLVPEKFINLLWNKNIPIKNIIRSDLTTFTMEINLEDYAALEELAKRLGARTRVMSRKGLAFFLMRLKRKGMLIGGVLIFFCILYYLSHYLWAVEINTEKYISPYEIRRDLQEFGIKPGIKKSKIDTFAVEDKIQSVNDNIMWVRARIEGSRLRIRIAEKTPPPQIFIKEGVNDIVSKADAEIIRIYSIKGTPAVKAGDLVKKGQVLIKGTEGKEGQEYDVAAKGDVIAKTFYESFREIKTTGVENIYTGDKDSSIFINIAGIKIYLKKATKSFESYDKMESSKMFYNIIDFYEKEEKEINIDIKEAVNEASKDLENERIQQMDKSSKVIEKKVFVDNIQDGIRVRMLFVVEENIAEVPILKE